MNETLLELVPTFLRAVASALPVLINRIPVTSTFATVAEEVLSAGAALIERGDEASQELALLAQEIIDMGLGDPTESQWDSLKHRSDAAHSALQAPAEDSHEPTP